MRPLVALLLSMYGCEAFLSSITPTKLQGVQSLSPTRHCWSFKASTTKFQSLWRGPHQIPARGVILQQGRQGNEFDRIMSNLKGQLGGLIVPTIVFTLLISGQFNWLFGIVNGFFLLFVVVPVVASIGFQLWYKSNTVEGSCPNCRAPVVVPKDVAGVCGACGTRLVVEDGAIGRASIYNTQQDQKTGQDKVIDVLDVEAIEIDSRNP